MVFSPEGRGLLFGKLVRQEEAKPKACDLRLPVGQNFMEACEIHEFL